MIGEAFEDEPPRRIAEGGKGRHCVNHDRRLEA
jgi:hypothetical protein